MLNRFKSLPTKTKLGILAIALVLIALPLTISLSQQQQNLTQNASEPGCAAKTDYLRQIWTGVTTFKQCESATQKADDVASYHFKSYDCSAKYGVPASSMIAVQTPLQDFVNIFGYHVPNVSCVYTCATSQAVAAGERCVDNPSNLTASQICAGSYKPSTSGHVCNPGRVCCIVANNTTCQDGVNQNCPALGAKQCTTNGAGVQVCSTDPTSGCRVWKTTELCQNNTCSGGACHTTADCTNEALRCLSTQPQKCVGGKWTNPVAACKAPFKCDQLTGACRCFPGDSCGATSQPSTSPSTQPSTSPSTSPSTQPTGSPKSSPTATPQASPNATKFTLVLGLDGIGSTGDTQNPNPVANSDPQYRSNPNPNHKTRNVGVHLLNSSGQEVAAGLGEVTYNPSSGKFEGTVSITQPVSNGSYSVLVKSTGYLRRKLATNLQADQGGLYNITGNLIAGDIDSDNKLTILDYNILISCSVFSTNSGACNANASYKAIASLTDTGIVDQNDYNLFQREIHNFQDGD